MQYITVLAIISLLYSKCPVVECKSKKLKTKKLKSKKLKAKKLKAKKCKCNYATLKKCIKITISLDKLLMVIFIICYLLN